MDSGDQRELGDLLSEYFGTAVDEHAESVLSRIISDYAAPTISSYFQRRINSKNESFHRRFGRFDAEDLASTAAIKLLVGLRRRRKFGLEGIKNLDAFIRTICNSIYSDYWRKRLVEYYKLKNRIRYLLTRPKSEFVVEHDEAGTLRCALTKKTSRLGSLSAHQIIENIKEHVPDHLVLDELTLVTMVLEQASGWVSVADLVKILADIRGIYDIPPDEFSYDDVYLDHAARDADVDSVRQEQVVKLKALWIEIRQLKRFQKLALLYHLRDADHREVNTVWFEAGVASLAEIAEQFEVTENEMATLLFRLPLSDKEIAESFCTKIDGNDRSPMPDERRVSTLRQIARANLQRRLDGKEHRKRHGT